MDIIFLCENKHNIYRAFTPEQIAAHPVLSMADVPAEGVPQAEAIFSTWGMPALAEGDIRRLFPRLRYVFYAAGTVQAFARPFLQAGVRVFSAWAANAVPVAEFAAAQIVLANKGYFQMHRRFRDMGHGAACAYGDGFCGNYHAPVGLLGAGMIGRGVIQRLAGYDIDIKLYDPYVTHDEAAALQVTKAELPDIFETCQTISNHMPDKPETRGILNGALFSRMKSNAVFINTGRGKQVVMADLLRAMADEPDRTALLDVTDPIEPLPPNHPAWMLPNVFITPHCAGSKTQEILRMGAYMFAEMERVINGQPVCYEVTLEKLERMA